MIGRAIERLLRNTAGRDFIVSDLSLTTRSQCWSVYI